jgi:hypothetical protein
MMSAMLDVARPGVRRREHAMSWALVAMAVLIALPVLWFVHLANQQQPLACQTSSHNVVNVIDSTMRDARTHVEGVQGVAVPHGDTGGSLDSGNIYVDDVYVGVGTWFANFTDVPRRTLGQYGVLQPINELAKAVSVNEFSFAVPNESRAASYSEHCVTIA